MSSKILSPVTTGTLLYALTKAPIRVRLPLIFILRRYVEPETVDRLIAALKWLFAIGLTRRVSGYLSVLAQSNYASQKSKYSWHNEVAVITGATGGFGSLMSKSLAQKGVRVMAIDIQDELPEDMKNNSRIHYYKCDVSDRAAIMAVAEDIRRVHGDPSILINNAGVSGLGRLMNLTEQSIKKTFDVNAISHYWTVQAFLPAMIQNKKGHIVSIASMASFATSPGLISYAGSKAAVLAFHEGIRQEVRLFHKTPEIQFSIIHPTYAATAMTAGYRKDLAAARFETISPEIVSDAVIKQILSGRGRQIILRGNLGPVEYFRAFPHWLSTGVFMLIERFVKVCACALSAKTKNQQLTCINLDAILIGWTGTDANAHIMSECRFATDGSSQNFRTSIGRNGWFAQSSQQATINLRKFRLSPSLKAGAIRGW